MANLICNRVITRIGREGARQVEDELLREDCWTLYCDGDLVFNHNCLSVGIEQMAVGQLRFKGLIGDVDDIEAIDIDEGKKEIRARLLPSARQRLAEHGTDYGRKQICAQKQSTPPAATFTAEDIHRLQLEFNTNCGLFRRTGSAHCCALADANGVGIFFEDVARHNAMDKLLGEIMMKRIRPEGKALLFSGRLALDMVQKAIATGVQVLVSPGAPTLAAVDAAAEHGLTLLGFVRPDNINIYCGADRILV